MLGRKLSANYAHPDRQIYDGSKLRRCPLCGWFVFGSEPIGIPSKHDSIAYVPVAVVSERHRLPIHLSVTNAEVWELLRRAGASY